MKQNKKIAYDLDSLALITMIVLNEENEFKNSEEDVKKIINELNGNIEGLWYVYKNLKEAIYGKIDLQQQHINNLYSPFENWHPENDDNNNNDDVVKNLHRVRKINSDFYYKLAMMYSEITNKDPLPETINTYNLVNDPDNGINALSLKLKKEKDKIDNLEKSVENKIKNNVYSEFITILGIFTAITFAIFGGMNLLTNLFKNIGNTQASLGQTLILAAVFGLIMWGIIELLFQWISKIKRTEDDTKDINKKSFNIIALCILGVILILGVVLFLNIPVVKIVHTILKSVHL